MYERTAPTTRALGKQMSILNDYISRNLSGPELEAELIRLITEYNRLRDTYLFIYSAAANKNIPAVPLEQADFYVIHDLLSCKKDIKKIDIYLETPGGRGETAEEIVRFLRSKFDTVSFVISSEAKSAGTIIALSGDEILMTETGSLGPIDAQMRIGRSVVSAYDYMDWINKKRDEAEKNGKLNPFDATMVAQITPGELENVYHALKFAEELVKDWIIGYKFGKWTQTETHKRHVTQEMKEQRASEIAKALTDHSKWRLHGRSIKAEDLEEIGLKIKRVDGDPKLADVIYRIQAVCMFLFEYTTAFKIFATKDDKIFRHAAPIQPGGPVRLPAMPLSPAQADVVELEQKCPKCGASHRIYAKLTPNPQIDADMKSKGTMPFPKDSKIKCACGFEIDLLGIKNRIELDTKKKIILEQ